MTPPVALTIAGVDSSGGAGLHADLRAFAAHRIHGASVVAAVTAQSTVGIEGVHVIPADFVAAQLDAVLGDLPVRATKTGFLATAEAVMLVAQRAADGAFEHLVVDPVLVTSAGEPMFPPEVTTAYVERLLPAATIATPNRVEAGFLVGGAVHTVADMEAAAVELHDRLGCAVVVKGGDASDEGERSIDVSVVDRRIEQHALPKIDTPNDHGSGCSFSAAITARLATGSAVDDAVRAAKDFVHAGLLGSRNWRLGAGHGPIDAFRWDGPE